MTSVDDTVTVLDHIENISVPGDPFREPANEYWALICLRDGMELLYRQATRCDEAVKQRVNPSDAAHFVGGGNLPDFHQVPQSLLTCAFHWYAISACQYVRTVGAIAHRRDPGRPRPDVYAQSVIPDVIAFRDKVAAHFAWSTQSNRDNDAERLVSILPPLTFVDDSFYVGELKATVRRSGTVSDSGSIRPWSISKIHEQLRRRYWPNDQQTSLDD